MIHAGTIRTGSGWTCVGGRRVLDELDQRVAEDHLAGGRWRRRARPEKPRRRRGLSRDAMRCQSSTRLRSAAHEIHAAVCGRSARAPRGLVSEEVRGREDVEQLARDESDDVLVMRRHAAHARGRVVPPLLGQQEALVHEVEGPAAARRHLKPSVLRQGLDAGRTIRSTSARRQYAESRCHFASPSRAIPSACRATAEDAAASRRRPGSPPTATGPRSRVRWRRERAGRNQIRPRRVL